MKKLILNQLAVIVCLQLSAQNFSNPYASIGKKAPKMATVTNGEYEEFFDKDSLVQIGTTIMNRNTGEVAFFAENNSEKFKNFTEHHDKNFRFLSIDPLTKSFPMLTPYQYASNTPISSIDLDGLEAKLAIWGIGWGDEASFKIRANALKSKSNGTTIHGIDNGLGLLNLLREQTIREGSIASFTVFSHGFRPGVILSNSAGFYKTGTEVPDNIGNAAFVEDIQAGMKSGDIKFEANAIALFAGCNLGSDYPNEASFASDFTLKTGVTSIAAEGTTTPEIVGGKMVDGKLIGGTETGRIIAKQFYMFEQLKDGTVTKTALGNTIDYSRYNSPMQTLPSKDIKQIETQTEETEPTPSSH